MKWLTVSVCLLLAAVSPRQDPPPKPALTSEIDRHLPVRGAAPAVPADDGVFLRRVMLDLVGYPPSGGEACAFYANPRPAKRQEKIDELLASDHFADLWARKFAALYFGDYHDVPMDVAPPLAAEDRSRIVARFVRWMRGQIERDRPYTETVAAMAGAVGPSEQVPALAWRLAQFRAGRDPAFEAPRVIARDFMGIQFRCATCHDHPFDKWGVDDYYGLAALYGSYRASSRAAQGGREVDVAEAAGPPPGPGIQADPVFPFSTRAKPAVLGETRTAGLARLMSDPGPDELHRAIVNRIWAWLLGRGIVHPADDFSLLNKAASPVLLKELARDFADRKHSIKHLVRAICNSGVYQRQSVGGGPRVDFSHALVTPLSSEQLLNALQVATLGSPGMDVCEAYEFSRRIHGRAGPECEVTPLAAETRPLLHLRNGERVWTWIREGSVVTAIRRSPATLPEKVEALFLAALSRRPTETETKRFVEFLEGRGPDRVDDAFWALLNTTEFMTRN